MSFTKDPAGTDLALNFDDTLFSLPAGQRPVADFLPGAEANAHPVVDVTPMPSTAAGTQGIFAPPALPITATKPVQATRTSQTIVPPLPVSIQNELDAGRLQQQQPDIYGHQEQTFAPQPPYTPGMSQAAPQQTFSPAMVEADYASKNAQQSLSASVADQVFGGQRLTIFNASPEPVRPAEHTFKPTAGAPAIDQTVKQFNAPQFKATMNQAPNTPAPSPTVTGPAQNELQTLRDLQRVTNGLDHEIYAGASKEELAAILEGFAHFMRNGTPDTFVNANYKDRTPEVMQLKELLIEAQETIIALLNDRVFDRAKISKLEAESRLMPDLQAQATRAMGLAMRSEEVQRELTEVRTEVEKLRTAYVRQETESSRGFFGWLLGRK